MEISQAYTILVNATARVTADREAHQLIIQALEVFQKLVPQPKTEVAEDKKEDKKQVKK